MASSETIENMFSEKSGEEDMNEHKRILKQQLDELISNHDQLQQSHESLHSSSLVKINRWEEESIEKIHQMADYARQELSIKLEKHASQFSRRSKELSDELKTARNDGTLMEMDFLQLSNKFNKLKSYLSSPPTIDFQDTTIVSKPVICAFPDDIFETVAGDLLIKDSGQLIEHGPSVRHAVVRGSGEYSSGEHRFQFRIENYNINQWIFFGVVSHRATLHSNTWAVLSCYGWGGQDSTILNCAPHAGFNGYSCDFQLDDIVELVLDCDHQLIRLGNKRTQRTHTIKIDLIKCPFPWHFLLNLFYPNDRVRILYTDI